MKVFITGAQGMLARDVIRELSDTFETVGLGRSSLDICDRESVFHHVREIAPDIVINCAAFTKVDACETEQSTAFAVNTGGVENIALACKETGSLLYHLSTDFVFDGIKREGYGETDTTNPRSVYGRSKLEGERIIQQLLTRYVIIRTSWLFGSGGPDFVSTMKRLAGEKAEISIVNDQTGIPTYTADLARALKALMKTPAQGIYHVCNSGACTWFDYAEKIFEFLGTGTRVVPITSQQLDRPAQRPEFSVLDCSRFIAETGFRMRSWETALQEYLTSLEEEEA
jgi:dTDP-4-dehydrorhamnose reductase